MANGGTGTEKKERLRPYYAGARAALPFALATLVLGVSFGVLARSVGWGPVAAIGSSVLICSGSAQFAIAAVLGSGGGVPAAVVAAVLLNARFGPMGVAVAPYLKGGPLRRALEGQAVIDASWALASRGGGSAVVVAGSAATLALLLVPFAPPGVPVIAACVAALLGLRRRP